MVTLKGSSRKQTSLLFCGKTILLYYSELEMVDTHQLHIRHCMLYEYRKGNNATIATQNICDVYPKALDVRKCQRWFAKFRSGNFDLSDAPRSGRPVAVDNDTLREVVEADPQQTIKELSKKLNAPWSTIQEHLKQIGKVNREGAWVPHSLSEEDKSITLERKRPRTK